MLRLLTLVCSCEAKAWYRSTPEAGHLRHCPDYLWISGGADRTHLDGNVLRVAAGDGWADLPAKMHAAWRWLEANTDYDHYFKIDDDTFVAWDRLLALLPDLDGVDLLGERWTTSPHSTPGGAGYILSRRALVAVADYRGRALRDTHEDRMVSRIVWEAGLSVRFDSRFHQRPEPKPLPHNRSITCHGLSVSRQRAGYTAYCRPIGDVPLITSIDHDPGLLDPFLDHYRQQGVTRFLVVNYSGEPIDAPDVIDHHVAADSPCPNVAGSSDAWHRDRLVRQHVGPGRWIVTADLDELHEMPGRCTLQQAVLDADAAGCDTIVGDLVDRTADDGDPPSLPPIDPGRPLAMQFPVRRELTRRIAQAAYGKILATRIHGVPHGHHAHDAAGRVHPRRGETHHYKWHAGMLPRLRDRVDHYDRRGVRWAPESRRLIDYFQEATS